MATYITKLLNILPNSFIAFENSTLHKVLTGEHLLYFYALLKKSF